MLNTSSSYLAFGAQAQAQAPKLKIFEKNSSQAPLSDS